MVYVVLRRESSELLKLSIESHLGMRLTIWSIDFAFHELSSNTFSSVRIAGVTPFKIDQNKKSKLFNRLSPESGNRKKGRYAKTLAEIQVTTISLMEDMRRNVFPKFIEICMETPCWCPPRWAPTWRPETSRNICLWILLHKREFISWRTQKRNSDTLF